MGIVVVVDVAVVGGGVLFWGGGLELLFMFLCLLFVCPFGRGFVSSSFSLFFFVGVVCFCVCLLLLLVVRGMGEE